MLPQHTELLRASAISPEVAKARGYDSVIDPGELTGYGFVRSQIRTPTLLIPLYNVWGRRVAYMHRPDEPRESPKKPGTYIKYEYQRGAGNILDVHPSLAKSRRLLNPREPLYITEGSRKADALVSAGLCAVSLNGVNGWRHTNEYRGKTAIPEWQDVALNGRRCTILFDSDSKYKRSIYQAAKALKEYLESKGAIVTIIYLPEEIPGVKVGADDFIASGRTIEDLAQYETDKLIRVHGYDTTTPIGGYELSPGGNADRLVDRYGHELRWNEPEKRWYFFAGTHWQEDDRLKVETLAQEIVLDLLSEARELKGDEDARRTLTRFALKSDSHTQIKQAVDLAKSRKARVISLPSEYDTHPWLLNLLNGTLDLQTGNLLPHDPADMLSQICPVHYVPFQDLSAETRHKFLHFINLLLKGDKEMIAFLKRFAGYCLTGSSKEGAAIYIKGPTRTGKSTFVQALKYAMGSYAWKTNFETFLSNRKVGGARNDVANMAKKRLVIASEVSRRERFNSELLKELSGGEEFNARQLYKEEKQIPAGVKIAFTANEFPWLPHEDTAAWNRLSIVEFDNSELAERENLDLKVWIKDSPEAHQAIIAWAVEGCLEWLEHDSLGRPEKVAQATEEQRKQFDPLLEFFNERLDREEGHDELFQDVFDAYVDLYRGDRSTHLIGKGTFRNDLVKAGIRVERGRHGQSWCYGVRIKREVQPIDYSSMKN